MNKSILENKKKILVIGVSASGKSTFAKKLSKKTGLPLFMMDTVMFKPDWEYIGDEESAKHIKKVCSKEEWILEGFIDESVRQFAFEKADIILYLNYNPFLLAWRYCKRCIQNSRDELPGCDDKFSFSFLKGVVTKSEAVSLNKALDKFEDKDKVNVLKSPEITEKILGK